jgi:Bacterial regulatory helix-turn-helix protein, lysR family
MGSDPTGPATVAGPDLRQMRYIVKVAELGGFTAAAAELHVAQQAVSQQVRATERMLDVTLFRRAPRAVTPTPAGEVSCARPNACSLQPGDCPSVPGQRRGARLARFASPTP